jgi:hypothetical protein
LDALRNESRARLIVSPEAEMSDHQREIYHSENGDRWLLCRDDDGRVFVLYYTKPTCLPAELRPKSSSETFSEEAKQAPSIKRLPG